MLSGIIEVLVNAIATELGKASDRNKLDLEKELIQFVELYHSLDKDTSFSRQSTATRRGNTRTPAHDKLNNMNSCHSKEMQGRISFFATSSIYQLLQMVLRLLDTDYSNNAEASQKHSQSNSKTSKCSSEFISFLLNVSLSHIRSSLLLQNEDPLKTLIYGEIKVLGSPLLKLINLFTSGPKMVTDQKKKEAKGKKDVGQREHLHLALICLKELITISCSSDLTGLLEDMVSISVLQDAGLENECEKASMVEDPHIRSKELFILKTLKPLFSELLALSFFGEVEVSSICDFADLYFSFLFLVKEIYLFLRSFSFSFQIICDLILRIGGKLPCQLRNSHGAWAISVCKNNEIKNSKVGKSVVTLATCLSSPPNDLAISQDMAKELLQVIGSEGDIPEEVSEVYPLINHQTSAGINSCIVHIVEAVVVEMDWAIKKLKTFSLVSQKGIHLNQNSEHFHELAFEENLYARAEAVVKVLSCFVSMSLNGTYAVCSKE